MKRVSVAATAVVVVIGCASGPEPGSSEQASNTLNARTLVSTSSSAVGPEVLTGHWVSDPLGSEDPDVETPDDSPKPQAARVRGFRRGRRVVVVSGVPNPADARAGQSAKTTAAIELRRYLGKVTILDAQRLTVAQWKGRVVIKSDDRLLEQQSQRWESGQLVVLRTMPQAVAVERYTADQDRSKLHVSVEVRVPGKKPMTFIRRFRRDVAAESDRR